MNAPQFHPHTTFTHLLCLRAVKVPAADLIVPCEHVHGHHADGERDRADDHLPGVRGHEHAVHAEQAGEHDVAATQQNR